MNRKSIVKSGLGLFAALCAALAFVIVDVGALTQNTNSSTTEQNTNSATTQDENANANTGRRGRRRGRRRARPAADANANADTSGAMTETTTTPDAAAGQDTGTQNTGGGTNEDLSGTYAGRIRMSGGHEMAGQGTLTITGNTFTLESEGMTHRGRIYAVNTRRYIGAALIFEDLTDPATNTPLACSVRARTGRTFSMTPVPGSRNKFTFTGRSTG